MKRKSSFVPRNEARDATNDISPVARVKAASERMRALRRAVRHAIAGDDLLAEASFDDLSAAVDEMQQAAERLQEESASLAGSLKAVESELHRYQDLFHLAPDGYLVTDAGGTIVEANHASEVLLDIGEDGLEGKPMISFLRDSEKTPTLRAQLGRLHLGGDIREWEVYVQPKEGIPFPVTVDVSAAHDAEGTVVGLHWQLHDITDRKRAEDELAFKASHDELTGLPNRSMFQELLRLALARARRRDLSVAVLYLDLDNFKLVNDTQGHPAGDELLCQVASRLSGVSREADLVARLGGDEFAILLSDLGRDNSVDKPAGSDGVSLTTKWVAGRIQECLRPAFFLAGTETPASASIGVSMFPEDSADEEELLEHADAAMYRSKKDGPGGVAGFSGRISNEKLTSFSARLSAAVEEKHWALHYQPIVDLGLGDVIGVEALLRWKRGDGSLIPPSEFIHLAEDMGWIESIGDWVLEEAARQARRWSQLGIYLDIALNVSGHQLWDRAFAHRVLSILESEDVDPSRVVIEITESAAMADPDRRLEVLWELHAHGIRLAIDDFGTGYSSLTRLKHLPVDILKIDRSFICDLPDRVGEGNLATATIQLAHSLGIVPLAEGIETTAQRDYLVAHGCPLGQGYLFGAPSSAHEMAFDGRLAGSLG